MEKKSREYVSKKQFREFESNCNKNIQILNDRLAKLENELKNVHTNKTLANPFEKQLNLEIKNEVHKELHSKIIPALQTKFKQIELQIENGEETIDNYRRYVDRDTYNPKDIQTQIAPDVRLFFN